MDDMGAMIETMRFVVPLSLLVAIMGEINTQPAREGGRVPAGRVGVSCSKVFSPAQRRRDPMVVPGGNLTDPQ